MSRRVTIMIDDDLDYKLRILQAKMIQERQRAPIDNRAGAVSFSFTLNETLRRGFKKK